jgi:two-component system, chemotaxis family, protein-glutamate methylesterase/glutaminase
MIRVLIVDDSGLVRRAIRKVLTEAGEFEIVGEAENGREGVDLACTLSPDIVTLDLEMPVMDGIEALRRLRVLSTAKVAVLSSLTHPATPKAVEARLLGADAVIGKPSGSVGADIDTSGGAQLVDTLRGLAARHVAGLAAGS